MIQTYEILGQTITMPVEVRAAKQAAAMFLVDATAAQKIIGPSGLSVARKAFNKTICSIAIVDYLDNDLGEYTEIALAFTVEEHPDLAGSDDSSVRTLIHRLPVSGEFTCAAGKEIWGFPKWVTDVDVEFHGDHAHATLRENGMDVFSIEMRKGRIPLPAKPLEMVAYSYDDHGVLRRTPWATHGKGAQTIRPGGCTIEVGYGHPFADELRALGFPKRALATIFDDNLTATFEPPTVI